MKCDEMKWKWAYFPYLDAPEKQHESAVNAGYVKVLLKAEADKVIAELRNEANVYKAKYEQEYDIAVHNEKQLSVMRIEIRHQKYNRCLAMARWCSSAEETYRPLGAFCGNESKEELFYARWADKWLELAEKFKPNNEVNNG